MLEQMLPGTSALLLSPTIGIMSWHASFACCDCYCFVVVWIKHEMKGTSRVCPLMSFYPLPRLHWIKAYSAYRLTMPRVAFRTFWRIFLALSQLTPRNKEVDICQVLNEHAIIWVMKGVLRNMAKDVSHDH